MPIPFILVCDLLDECHRLCLANKSNTRAVVDWFARHRGRIDAHDTDLAALLSTLLPEKRTDRVYCIKATTLERVVGRALMLGSSRIAELAVYKQPGQGVDLADCVERILTATVGPNSCSIPCSLLTCLSQTRPALRNFE
jgi:DNA ligase-4